MASSSCSAGGEDEACAHLEPVETIRGLPGRGTLRQMSQNLPTNIATFAEQEKDIVRARSPCTVKPLGGDSVSSPLKKAFELSVRRNSLSRHVAQLLRGKKLRQGIPLKWIFSRVVATNGGIGASIVVRYCNQCCDYLYDNFMTAS